jgi:hypothetical protein
VDGNGDINCNPNAYLYRVHYSESDRYSHRIAHPHANADLHGRTNTPAHAVANAHYASHTDRERQPEPNLFTVADVTTESHPHGAAVGHAVPNGNPDCVIHRDGDGHAAPYGNYHRHPYGLAHGIRDGRSFSVAHALGNADTRPTAECDADGHAIRVSDAITVCNRHRHSNRRSHTVA